jgi:hypothetical protein
VLVLILKMNAPTLKFRNIVTVQEDSRGTHLDCNPISTPQYKSSDCLAQTSTTYKGIAQTLDQHDDRNATPKRRNTTVHVGFMCKRKNAVGLPLPDMPPNSKAKSEIRERVC